MSLPKDFWIGLAMLVSAACYWLGAEDIPISPLDGAVNASAMPKMLAVALGLLALMLMAQAFFKWQQANQQAAQDNATSQGQEGSGQRWHEHRRALGLIGIGAAYLVLLPVLGYWIGVALLIAVTAIYMGARPSLRLGALSLALATCFYLLFVQLLHIQLPAGLLGSLLFK
jgi:putative tricarboxylic transport membrane protein